MVCTKAGSLPQAGILRDGHWASHVQHHQNNLDDKTVSTITRFADDTTLGGEVDVSEGRAISQDQDRLEERTGKKNAEFNRDKCKVLQQ